MKAIILYTLSPLNMTYSCHVTPLLAVLALWYSWIHVCTMNCYNVTTDIELMVNNFLGIWSILGIPNVDPYDGHVRLGRYLDYMWFGSEDYIIE